MGSRSGVSRLIVDVSCIFVTVSAYVHSELFCGFVFLLSTRESYHTVSVRLFVSPSHLTFAPVQHTGEDGLVSTILFPFFHF